MDIIGVPGRGTRADLGAHCLEAVSPQNMFPKYDGCRVFIRLLWADPLVKYVVFKASNSQSLSDNTQWNLTGDM